MAEYRQGVGANRLPQGAAGGLNRATPSFDITENSEIPVEYADAEPERPLDTRGQSENKQVLLQPPNPGFAGTAVPQDRAGRVPRYIVRHLPQLSVAVKDPTAPPALRAIYAAIVRQLELER